MISYKGFYVYLCDPDTYEELQYIGNFELSIIQSASVIADGTRTGSQLREAIDVTYPDERYNISGLIGSDVFPEAGREARTVCPLVRSASFVNDTNRTCRIKLLASNGYFAISTDLYSTASTNVGSPSYNIFNAENVNMGVFSLGFLLSNYAFVFLSTADLSDGVPSTGTLNTTLIYCHYNNTDDNYRVDSLSTALTSNIAAWLNAITQYAPSDDPYALNGGSSTPTEDASDGVGGGGSFDGTSTPVDFPALPTLSAVDTGFIRIYNPTLTQLKNLANYMWGNLFDVTTWKKIFADPMDAILGMSIVPVVVPNAGSQAVTIGNISTSINMNVAGSQYVEVDCGTIDVVEYWGAYLDYAPYTKAEIYLPYCGIHPIAIDDIMGKTIHVKYHVDILSGACCAYVKCGESVLYSFLGQCSSSIPITGNDWTNVINGVLSAAVSIGSMVATHGVTAPTAVPSLASTAINASKPNIERSGALGGTGGMMAIQTPYLILTRPKQAIPSHQNYFIGYPSFTYQKLQNLIGYTEIESCHLENVHATDPELSEIENLLKTGVIL